MNARTILHATCHLVIKNHYIDLGPLARLCSRTKDVYLNASMLSICATEMIPV